MILLHLHQAHSKLYLIIDIISLCTYAFFQGYKFTYRSVLANNILEVDLIFWPQAGWLDMIGVGHRLPELQDGQVTAEGRRVVLWMYYYVFHLESKLY